MQSISVNKPTDSSYESARFEAQLEVLGIEEANTCDTIQEEEADKFVKGGFKALVEAAKVTGLPNAIDQHDLDSVEPKYSPLKTALLNLGIIKNPHKVADKKINNAIKALHNAVDSLELLDDIKTADTLLQFMQNVNTAADKLGNALEVKKLGNAHRDTIDQLKSTFTYFYQAFSNLKSLKISSITAWGSAASTLEAFPYKIHFLMESAPPRFDLDPIDINVSY